MIRDRSRFLPQLARNDAENPANHIGANHSLDQSSSKGRRLGLNPVSRSPESLKSLM